MLPRCGETKKPPPGGALLDVKSCSPRKAAVLIGRPEGRRAKVEPRFRKGRSRENDGVPASDERNGGEEIKGSQCGLIVAEATL